MPSAGRAGQEQMIYNRLVYPGSHVLRNKLDITDQSALEKAEADVVSICEPTRPIFKCFTLTEMQTIHRHLLGDVYNLAGQIRTYTTGRNTASFARPEHIRHYFETTVSNPLRHERYLKGTSRQQFAERGAYFANEINAIHPFIDGNGRMTRLWLKDLSKQAGYGLDIIRLEASQGAWYAAMKEGFESGNLAKLEKEILNALE